MTNRLNDRMFAMVVVALVLVMPCVLGGGRPKRSPRLARSSPVQACSLTASFSQIGFNPAVQGGEAYTTYNVACSSGNSVNCTYSVVYTLWKLAADGVTWDQKAYSCENKSLPCGTPSEAVNDIQIDQGQWGPGVYQEYWGIFSGHCNNQGSLIAYEWLEFPL